MKNYFFDENPDYKEESFTLKCRKDPDKCSKELYDDLIKTYFSDKGTLEKLGIKSIENTVQNFGKGDFYTLFVNGKEFLLSADYIGPSVWWSKSVAGYDDRKILDKILSISRTLGGHTFWPRGFGNPTINTARGGKSAFYDRFDWTLLLLSAYYENSEGLEGFLKAIQNKLPKKEEITPESRFENMFQALKNSDSWLKKFETFDCFCTFHRLKGNFTDEKSVPKELVPYFPIKPSEEDYKKYIEKNLACIQERNKLLMEE